MLSSSINVLGYLVSPTSYENSKSLMKLLLLATNLDSNAKKKR